MKNTSSIYQNAPVIAVMNGIYKGFTALSEFRKYGNQGLGTIDKLNGEIVFLDGQFYNFDGTGNITVPDESTTTPWLCVDFFNPTDSLELSSGLDFNTLPYSLADRLPARNTFISIRIDGVFRQIQTRSFSAQEENPGPPIERLEAFEPRFNYENIKGTMVGYISPTFSHFVGIPGWHLHFISDDRKSGGHVLSMVVDQATLHYQRKKQWIVGLPERSDYDTSNLEYQESGITTSNNFYSPG